MAVAQELSRLGSGAQGVPLARELAGTRAPRQQVRVLQGARGWPAAGRRHPGHRRAPLPRLPATSWTRSAGSRSWGCTRTRGATETWIRTSCTSSAAPETFPACYYYRRWEDQARWTPWEPVPLDIQADHLIPIVYNGRLYVFWPEFKKTENVPDTADLDDQIDVLDTAIADWNQLIDETEAEIKATTDPVTQGALQNLLNLYIALKDKEEGERAKKEEERQAITDGTARYTIELGISWSEYQSGRWTAKKLSKSKETYLSGLDEARHYFLGGINDREQLYIDVHTRTADISGLGLDFEDTNVANFELDVCHGEVIVANASSAPLGTVTVLWSLASHNHLESTYVAELSLQITKDGADDTRDLLGRSSTYLFQYYYAHQYGLGGKETSPFFYADDKRTYFVRPPTTPFTAVPSSQADIQTTRRGAGAARLATTPGQKALSTAPHFQGTNAEQIIDRTLPESSSGVVRTQIASLASILG